MGVEETKRAGSGGFEGDARLRRVELLLSVILRTGVIVSFIVIVAGTVLAFARQNEYASTPEALRHLTEPGAAYPRTLGAIFADAFRGRGQALIMLGLLLLIATPVIRVAASVAVFALQRDRAFVMLTLIVLVLLLAALWLGR
jgi:uncharacterized membrane protein